MHFISHLLSHPVSHVGWGDSRNSSSWSLKEFSLLSMASIISLAELPSKRLVTSLLKSKSWWMALLSNSSTCTSLNEPFKVPFVAILSESNIFHCDSARTTLQPHGEHTKHVWDKAIKEVSAGQHCVPCTMLGTVRYIMEVNNFTLFWRSPQQSNCEMTPTQERIRAQRVTVGSREGKAHWCKNGESKGRHREANHAPENASYSWLSCKEV